MNEYDSGKMADVLRVREDMEPTDNPHEADIIVFNTCSIREKAEEKVFSDLGRVRPLKLAKSGLLIAVGGCVASQEGAAILKRAPYVDVGLAGFAPFAAIAGSAPRNGTLASGHQLPGIEKFIICLHLINSIRHGLHCHHRGVQQYLHVFCVVPYTRGAEVSRPFEDVLRDVEQLVAQGVKEVTLLGQNVNAYCGVFGNGDTLPSRVSAGKPSPRWKASNASATPPRTPKK